jgi:tetratricopeptide (TPR) repeat protein
MIALVFFAASSIAAAQAEPTAAARAEAQAEFQAGERAFSDDDYGLALERFRHAFELAPHDAVRFNIAVCLERLGRFREATLEYEAAQRSVALDDEGRARASELAGRTRSRLGTLAVDSAERARVEVGGVTCETPCLVEMDPGNYELVARGTGEARTRVEIRRGTETRVRVDTSRIVDAPIETPPVVEPDRGWSAFGVMLGIGAGLATVGGAGMIGFGLAAMDAHDRYYGGMASESLAQDGELYRDLFNASIAVTSVGVILVAIDLILLAVDP